MQPMSHTVPATRLITGLQEIIAEYDACVFDIWGVLHNGQQVFPEALDTLNQLKARGTPVALLSNAPRLASQVADQLLTLGIPEDLWSHLITSGGMAHTLLADWIKNEGPHCFFMGQPPHKLVLESFNLICVADPREADFIYNSGPDDIVLNLHQYQQALTQARDMNLKMFCTNPDVAVMVGKTRTLCAGTLAQFYTNLGGDVFYTGKPHLATYTHLFQRTGFSPKRTLCVGDSMAHDIQGGFTAGCDTALVFTGIHDGAFSFQADISASLQGLVETYDVTPTYAMPALKWA